MKLCRTGSLGMTALLVAGAFSSSSCGRPATPEANAPSSEQPSAPDDRAANGAPPSVAPAPVDAGLVARLSQADTRSAAVDDLVQRYAAAARNGTQAEPARAFAEHYAGAASEAYVAAGEELNDKRRLALMTTLVALAHPKTAPALAHAISRYVATGVGVEEAIAASQGAARISSPEVKESLLGAYETLDTSNADGLRFSRHLAAAMSAHRDDAWNDAFMEVLTQPLVRPERFDDKPAVKAFQSGLFRQTIAARLLGESGARSATPALLRVLLDGNKSEVHPAAELAIVKLKANAVPQLLELLRGEGELVSLTREARKDEKQAHVYFATKWLDLLRLPSTAPDLLEAWGGTKDPVARTLLVRSLSRLPGSKAGIDELKATYNQTDIKVTLPEGESALETLSDAAVQFFEPELTLWLEARVSRVPTVWTRRGDVQVALVLAMSRLVTADQVKATSAAAQKYGGKPGTPAFESASLLAQNCKSDAACYVKSITSAPTPFSALKAVTMAAIYGDVSTRDALIELALETDEQELLNQLLIAIEHLTTADAADVASAMAAKSQPNLEGPSSTWPRGKRAAFNATIARLQAR